MSDSRAIKKEPTEAEAVEDAQPKARPKQRSSALKASHQPKDIYAQLDSTVRDMTKRFSSEPYVSSAYKSTMQLLPIIDPVTKQQIASGDTSNLRELYLTPAFHYINQRLFNYPRSVLNRAGFETPQSETVVGRSLAATAGVTGALQSFDVGRAITSRIPGLAAKAGLAKTGRSVFREGAKSFTRGGLAGAAQGGLYAPENLRDFRARGQQAGIGFLIGGLVGPVSDKVSAWVKHAGKTKKGTIKARVSKRRADVDFEKTVEQVEGDKVVDEALNLLGENQKELQDVVAMQQVQGKVPQTKNAFQQWGKNVRNVYNATIDDISREIGDIDSVGAKKFFTEFADNIQGDPELGNTAAYLRVRKFADKLDDNTKTSFESLNNKRIDLLKRKYRGDIDDVVYTKFRKSFAEYAETIDNTGRFAKLNETMSPQLEFKYKFLRKTKIYDKYESRGLEDLFKKYSSGKNLTVGERELMNDAVEYLSKYGVDAQDIKEVYKNISTTSSTASRIKAGVKADTGGSKLEQATRKRVRAKQDITLGSKGKTEMGRIAYQALNTAIRLSFAGMALNALSEFKKRAGTSSAGLEDSHLN